MSSATDSVRTVTEYLSSKGFSPTSAWVGDFLSTQRANVPEPALRSSALFKMIHGDITQSVRPSSSNVMPTDIYDATRKERKLPGPIPVQILDIEDMSQSRWSQAEALEAVERGETTRGREIIRVVASEIDFDQQQNQVTATQGPHKFTVQDANGTQAFAFELLPVPNLNLNKTMIGCKLVLKDVIVARAVLLLTPGTVLYSGGKIDNLHQQWQRGRKETLREAARAISQSSF